MLLFWIVLPLELKTQTPSLSLPEITFNAPATGPPIVCPEDKLITTPYRFGSLAVAVLSVPMKLPCTLLLVPVPARNTPSSVLPEMTFAGVTITPRWVATTPPTVLLLAAPSTETPLV
jgi:hypothetical protein